MKINRQIWILVSVLTGLFLAGFLTGLTLSRPIKEIFPKRAPADDPLPEDFIRNFSDRMTENLNLREDQIEPVEEKVREMTRRIRAVQKEFIPQINRALLDAIDEILPLLDPDQKEHLTRRRDGIANSPHMYFNPGGPPANGGFGPPNGTQRGPQNNNFQPGDPPWGSGAPPWGDGPPPWGDGPPPWQRNRNTPSESEPVTPASPEKNLEE